MSKERITVTIDKDLLRWIDEKVKKKIFANRSHAFEYLAVREKEKKNEKKKE